MATLTAWKFDTPDGAEQAVATLKNLASQELYQGPRRGHRVVARGQEEPEKTRQLNDLAGAGALGGAFWPGCWFGLIFSCCSSGWRSVPPWED